MRKKLKDIRFRLHKWLAEPAHLLGVLMIALALIIIVVGYINQNFYYPFEVNGKNVEWFVDSPIITDFYANVSSELISIAITILIVDYLYRLRDERREDQDLILQAGSPDNAFAIEAIRQIRAKGKLVGTQGLLSGAYLEWANWEGAVLEGANLKNAKLEGVNLKDAAMEGVNLTDADLGGANLKRADLYEANLTNAFLADANLEDTNLEGANLKNAFLAGAENWTEEQLLSAMSLEGATMPDGIWYEDWIVGRKDQEQEQAIDEIQEQESKALEPLTQKRANSHSVNKAFVWLP